MNSIRLLRRAGVMVWLAAASAFVVSCGSNPVTDAVSGVIGDNDDEDENAPAEDERISILALEETLEADPRYAGVQVDVPPSYRNVSWTQPGGEADHTLHHLSAAVTFETAWKTDIGKASERAVLTSPPVAADGRLYVMDAAARVTAYNIENGEQIWRAELTPKIKEKFRIQEILSRPNPAEIGFGGGVAYDNGRIFVTSGFGFAAALNAETGEELWRTELEAPVRTPPTAFRGAVYFVSNVN